MSYRDAHSGRSSMRILRGLEKPPLVGVQHSTRIGTAWPIRYHYHYHVMYSGAPRR